MTFVFRNNTIERFLPADYHFSGYDDVSFVPADATDFVWWYQLPLRLETNILASQIDVFAQKLQLLLPQIGTRQLIIFTLVDIASVAIQTSDDQLQKAISRYNNLVLELSATNSNIKVIDFYRFTRQYATSELIDWKFYFLSQMPLNPKLAAPFKAWYHRQLESISLQRRKCLVLDLDNTLWAGVLGEDGVSGIKMSGDYPGEAFHLWQSGLKQLQQSGVILAICSKNNENDVLEMWQRRDDVLLHREDFAALRINWQDKAKNIQEIAKELNIGLDSMVFADDNPAERELIRQQLPMVAVPEFPAEAYRLPQFYKQLVEDYFQIYLLTEEDKHKTEQYINNARRTNYVSEFTDMTDYLRSLDMQLTIAPINDISLPRAAQMTQKTNQFNLTTRRYTEADLRDKLLGGMKGWTLSVADKFGDNGITGLLLLTPDGVIDTYLLSCRILGRGIENVFLKAVLLQLKDKMQYVRGQYIPTQKNGMTMNFYVDNGFYLYEQGEAGEAKYRLNLSNIDISIPSYYKISFDNE